jgi:hypothetical protein
MTRRYPYSIPKQLRWTIYSRDGGCVLARLEEGHVCRDQWNQVHAPNDFDRLTLEHVHTDGSMMGKRAPSDERHMVTLCAAANIGVPSRKQRNAFRAYLEVKYGILA